MERFPDSAYLDTGKSALPKQDGTAERLVKLMDASGVAFALNVQVPWYGDREDNRYHHDAVARFPGRFAFLCVLDLDMPGAGERFEHSVAHNRAQGVRIHLVEPGRVEKVCGGAHDDVLATALRLDVPVQLLAGTADQLVAAEYIARHFDGVRIIVDHLCHPNPKFAPDYAAWAPFFALARYPRSYVKVSLQCECSHAPFPFTDLHGYEKRTLEAFTPQRCMWGSNYPLIPERYRYEQILSVVRDHLPGLDEAERARVLGGTAAELWSPS